LNAAGIRFETGAWGTSPQELTLRRALRAAGCEGVIAWAGRVSPEELAPPDTARRGNAK
jgi:hypothetical protein